MKAEILMSVGDIIFYKLRLSDLPINQERVWKGKIESVYSSFVLVSSLDEGYEGLREAVWPSQVITAVYGKNEPIS